MRVEADMLKTAAQNSSDVKLGSGMDLWIRAGHGRYQLDGTNRTISALELQRKIAKMPDMVIIAHDITAGTENT